jgi:cytochrome c oxidase subunit III
MAIIGDRVEVERKPKLGGGGPGKIPFRRGYGGGDDGDHDRSGDFSPSRQRLRRGRIGVALGITCVTALFIGLTIAYIARLGVGRWDSVQGKELYGWKPFALPYLLLWINTSLLLLSSVSLEMARRGMEKKMEFSTMGILPPKLKPDLPWLNITVGLGFGFLVGQMWVWDNLRAQGIYLNANFGNSFFYILTGAHALHLLGGLAVLLYAACGSWLRVRFESQRIAVDVTAWYWHFMAILWLWIFGLLAFVRP